MERTCKADGAAQSARNVVFSQLSCGHLLFRAEHKLARHLFSVMKISDIGRTGVKGSQENGPGFNAEETFLFI